MHQMVSPRIAAGASALLLVVAELEQARRDDRVAGEVQRARDAAARPAPRGRRASAPACVAAAELGRVAGDHPAVVEQRGLPVARPVAGCSSRRRRRAVARSRARARPPAARARRGTRRARRGTPRPRAPGRAAPRLSLPASTRRSKNGGIAGVGLAEQRVARAVDADRSSTRSSRGRLGERPPALRGAARRRPAPSPPGR